MSGPKLKQGGKAGEIRGESIQTFHPVSVSENVTDLFWRQACKNGLLMVNSIWLCFWQLQTVDSTGQQNSHEHAPVMWPLLGLTDPTWSPGWWCLIPHTKRFCCCLLMFSSRLLLNTLRPRLPLFFKLIFYSSVHTWKHKALSSDFRSLAGYSFHCRFSPAGFYGHDFTHWFIWGH